MRRRTWPIEDLRLAIDCLPVRTRVAMLEGVRANEIIAGAYVDRRGGVCPMLAAHRCGGRTDFLSFARAWDRFTGARGRSRRATVREISILTTHLEASLLAEDALGFEQVIAAHRASLAARVVDEPAPPAGERPGDLYREPELRHRSGWSWLRPFRRLDDYERALRRVEREHDRLEVADADAERELEPVG
jgi:hypothetical protein